MIFTLEWLKEYLDTTKSAEEVAVKLNQIGLEVENDLPSESIFDKVVVAEIVECENHPESDHLHICKVNDGKEVHQIVCGAPNARKGIKVALAHVGAYIPYGDFRIKKSKIRGVDSCGMMCSEREMGIGNDHEGIMELPSDCKLGDLWVKAYHALDKMPIEVSITPNRGDATSVYGIARDLSAAGFGELKKTSRKTNLEQFKKIKKQISDKLDDIINNKIIRSHGVEEYLNIIESDKKRRPLCSIDEEKDILQLIIKALKEFDFSFDEEIWEEKSYLDTLRKDKNGIIHEFMSLLYVRLKDTQEKLIDRGEQYFLCKGLSENHQELREKLLDALNDALNQYYPSVRETIKNTHSVEVKIDNCQYFCREIRGLNANATTPKYILKRNAFNGCGDNGVIVNILNYIMFEYGQPMHSYDADKIGKKIIVDYAKRDTFKTLKGEEIKFDKSKILMVSDEENDLCIAGIMGGDDCKTTTDTKNILLECAYFPTTPITIGGQELKIVSDARFRYERGINPDLTREMLDKATAMISEICGGEASNVEYDGKLADEKVINYHLSTTKKLLGFDISADRTVEILEKLQFEIADKSADVIKIKVPRFRHDVEIEADIAEELGRIEGYDKIPSEHVNLSTAFTKNKFAEKLKTKKFLAGSGLMETVSMAFCDEKKAALFADINADLRLANPIASELNYMRPTLLVSLLQTVKTNESQVLENQLAFFEEGMFFTAPQKDGQHNSVAAVYCGHAIANDHFKEGRQFDIFDAKKTLFELLEDVYKVNLKSAKIDKCDKKYVHPTRSFDVKLKGKDGEKVIATFGEISPVVLKEFEIKNPVCFFELFTYTLPEAKQKHEQFIENPIQPIVRDIAFVVDENITANQLVSAFKDNMLTDIKIVDIYKMPLVGQKSVALRYIFEPKENITTEQVNAMMDKIIKAVETKTGGKVRDGR